jgi:hypothetical protein
MKLQLEWGRPILLRDAGREENLGTRLPLSETKETHHSEIQD